MKFPYHPAADLMPPMTPEERAELRASIKSDGLHDPIEIYDGMILDGRSRQEACDELGLEMSSNYVTLTPHMLGPHHCPFRYVLAKHTRRNLTSSQKAMAVAKLQRAQGGEISPPAKLGRNAAAAAVGVDRKQVTAAATVLEKGSPETIKSIEKGEMAVYQAKKLVEAVPDKKEQAKVIGAGKEEVKRRISGGTSFDVAEIEGAEAEPGRKPKNGAPLVSTKDRKEAVKACDALSRWLHKLGVYDEFMKPMSAIRERLVALK